MEDSDGGDSLSTGAERQTAAAIQMGGPHEEPEVSQGDVPEERPFPSLVGNSYQRTGFTEKSDAHYLDTMQGEMGMYLHQTSLAKEVATCAIRATESGDRAGTAGALRCSAGPSATFQTKHFVEILIAVGDPGSQRFVLRMQRCEFVQGPCKAYGTTHRSGVALGTRLGHDRHTLHPLDSLRASDQQGLRILHEGRSPVAGTQVGLHLCSAISQGDTLPDHLALNA